MSPAQMLVAVVYEVQRFLKAREHVQEGISAIFCKAPTWFLGIAAFVSQGSSIYSIHFS